MENKYWGQLEVLSQKATLNFPATQVSSILWICHCHHVASISPCSKVEWFPAIMATFLPTGNEQSQYLTPSF